MRPEIKLVITHSDKVIQSVIKEFNEQGFVKSLEEFKIIANATMTKLIEDSEESGDCIMEEDADGSEDEDEDGDEDGSISPKKKKK